jgi:D-alanyl-D-alanine carboxypeptidase
MRYRSAMLLIGVVLAGTGPTDGADRGADRHIEISDLVRYFKVDSPLAARWIDSRHPAKAFDADDCVEQAMSAVGTPGASMAIWRDGVLVTSRGYGVKRRGQDDPVTPQTVFRIGSITKMMTAAAVLQQVEVGRVDLTAPITDLIPEFGLRAPWFGGDITPHHLLTHTSGFPDRLSDVEGRTDAEALSDWAAQQSVTELHATPGAFWNYSNPNFMLAGLVAERAAGMSYHQYMKDQVWAPAGMLSTFLIPAEAMAAGDWSYGHLTDPSTGVELIIAPDDYDHWAAAPAGWAFSTATDLVRWAELLMDGGGTVLTPESVALMTAPLEPTRYAATEHYGYGVA